MKTLKDFKFLLLFVFVALVVTMCDKPKQDKREKEQEQNQIPPFLITPPELLPLPEKEKKDNNSEPKIPRVIERGHWT